MKFRAPLTELETSVCIQRPTENVVFYLLSLVHELIQKHFPVLHGQFGGGKTCPYYRLSRWHVLYVHFAVQNCPNSQTSTFGKGEVEELVVEPGARERRRIGFLGFRRHFSKFFQSHIRVVSGPFRGGKTCPYYPLSRWHVLYVHCPVYKCPSSQTSTFGKGEVEKLVVEPGAQERRKIDLLEKCNRPTPIRP